MSTVRSMFVAFTLALSACALLPQSPEKQILTGANSVAAAANLTTTLLRRGRITMEQAKNYRAMMQTASDSLDSSNAALIGCRSRTGSTSQSSPDPCKGNVASDINLATSILSEIEATLKAQE